MDKAAIVFTKRKNQERLNKARSVFNEQIINPNIKRQARNVAISSVLLPVLAAPALSAAYAPKGRKRRAAGYTFGGALIGGVAGLGLAVATGRPPFLLLSSAGSAYGAYQGHMRAIKNRSKK